MRREADDTGPLAELEHWRFLMSKFNSLLEHIKSERCKTAINTLHLAKSKVLKVRFKLVILDPYSLFGFISVFLFLCSFWMP